MAKIQKLKYGFRKLEFRISNLFRISIFEFRILAQRGVSLYLALLIMAIFLSIALGLNAIFLNQSKLARTMGFSANAFSAADTGLEKVLIDRENPNLTPDFYSGSFSNGATYRVIVTQTGTGGCLAANFCIKSIGDYKEVRRAIEISY